MISRGYGQLAASRPQCYLRRMRLLVTGASGLLGRALMRLLADRPDIDTLGLAHSRAKAPLVRADIGDEPAIAAILSGFAPDVVLHAAAERRPDVVDREPERAAALNVDATLRLARLAAGRGAFFIYISTDYVFDGSNPPYFPDSPVHPLNAYGAMKLEGERGAAARVAEAQAAGKTSSGLAIVRIPLLYGPVERLDECSVTEIAAKLAARYTESLPCPIEDWATRYPAHVDDVARALIAVIDARSNAPESTGGIYQLSGPVGYSKYGMALIMARALGMAPDFILPERAEPSGAPRPKDCRMDTRRLAALGWTARIGFPEGIAPVLSPHFAKFD